MNDKRIEQELLVVDALNELNGPATLDDLADLVRLPKTTVRFPVRRLEDAEVLVRTKRGHQTFFTLVELPRNSPLTISTRYGIRVGVGLPVDNDSRIPASLQELHYLRTFPRHRCPP